MLPALSKSLLIYNPQKRPNPMKNSCFIRKRDHRNAVVFQVSGNGRKRALGIHKVLKGFKAEDAIKLPWEIKTTVNIHDDRFGVKTIYINTIIDDSFWKEVNRKLLITADVKNRVTRTSIQSLDRPLDALDGVRVVVKTCKRISHVDPYKYNGKSALNNTKLEDS